jgi:cytosine/uracil/thiamine/allantoin permease
MVMVYAGINWIRRMQKVIAPLVLLFVFSIFCYFASRVGSDMFSVTGSADFIAQSTDAAKSNYLIGAPQNRNSVGGTFFARITTILGFWSSFILNIPVTSRPPSPSVMWSIIYFITRLSLMFLYELRISLVLPVLNVHK